MADNNFAGVLRGRYVTERDLTIARSTDKNKGGWVVRVDTSKTPRNSRFETPLTQESLFPKIAPSQDVSPK